MEYTLTIDKWERNFDKGTSHRIGKHDVKRYLQLLDGNIHSIVVIIPDDSKSSLMVGGGNDSVYVVIYTVGADDDFYNLINPKRTGDKEIEVVTGGQAGLFLEKYCVDFEAALAAATYYLETGERDPTLVWEKQV